MSLFIHLKKQTKKPPAQQIFLLCFKNWPCDYILEENKQE